METFVGSIQTRVRAIFKQPLSIYNSRKCDPKKESSETSEATQQYKTSVTKQRRSRISNSNPIFTFQSGEKRCGEEDSTRIGHSPIAFNGGIDTSSETTSAHTLAEARGARIGFIHRAKERKKKKKTEGEAFNLGSANFWWKYFTDMLVEQMLTEHVRNFTVPVHTTINSEDVKAAYDDVRSDATDTKWAVLKYKETTITVAATGTDFQEFKNQFGDSERCYGFIRLQTGDEMSKRTKFILITWVGKNVGVMHRAKVTNDKSLVKEIITGYAAEFQLESASELDEKFFTDELSKIGGAKYGTGVSV